MFWDIGMSVLISYFVSSHFDVPLTPAFIILNIIFGLLPDFDTPIELFQRGRIGGKIQGFHGEYTHYPAIYIPIAIAVYLIFGKIIGTAFTLNITAHLLHDIMPFNTGWGMKLFWPLSHKRIKLFTTPEGKFTHKKLFSTWNPRELKETIKKYGNENWIRDIYLRPSPILIIELSLLTIAVVILLAL